MADVLTFLEVFIVFALLVSIFLLMELSVPIITNAKRLECAPTAYASTWMEVSSVDAILVLNYRLLDMPATVSFLWLRFFFWNKLRGLLDIDECYENPRICLNGRCDNTPGSYTCACLPGFIDSSDKTFCTDLDECANTGNSLLALLKTL